MFSQPVFNQLTMKATQVNRSASLDMEPFIDLYGLAKVKEDYSKIAGKILSYDKPISKAEAMGPIFEAAFLDIGQRGQWFGENSELVRASKFDDIENGIDTIATMVAPDTSARHLAIASDLTFSYPKVSAKFNRIVTDAFRGKLAEIKYFHSELLHFTGKQSNVPRTVIGLESKNLNQMLLRWLKEPELTQLQYGSIIMQQIAAQCETLSLVAYSKHKDAFGAYRRVADTAHILLRTHYKDIEPPEDKILDAIKGQSARLKSEFS
ncbi:MAG: hypothetical protein RLZZ360_284 [Candidatus Parcubacteria bacterium]